MKTDIGQVRMVLSVKRKEGMTFDEFSKHWLEVHGPLFVNSKYAKEHLISYEQYHTGPERAEVEKKLGYNNSSSWDGIAVCVFDSVEGMKKVFSTKEMATTIMADNKKFIGKTARTIFYGKPHLLWSMPRCSL